MAEFERSAPRIYDEVKFALANDDIMIEISSGDFVVRGYLSVNTAEELRSELTRAINKWKKEQKRAV